MSWRQSFSSFSIDVLRSLFQGILLFDAIVIALFSAWFCVKATFQLADWLGNTLFS